ASDVVTGASSRSVAKQALCGSARAPCAPQSVTERTGRRSVPTSTARAGCFICRVSCHLSPTLALTFRELEAFPRTGLAGLLALLHARIPAEQTLSFQRASEIDIDLEKSTLNRNLRGASLSHDAAAGCVNRQ